jgi:hypothetical protein
MTKTIEDETEIERHTEIEIEILKWLGDKAIPSIEGKALSWGSGPYGGYIRFELKGHRFSLTFDVSDAHCEMFEKWEEHDEAAEKHEEYWLDRGGIIPPFSS